jgi:hypothetical protein
MIVAKWYTRASRIRIVIAKFDGRWKLPGGPYPIPELVALVTGIIATLFMLPRLGHPLLTGVIGLLLTAGLVAVMRRMPYSPVPFGTRVHRIMRLYTAPVSFSTGDELMLDDTVSVVRPQIDILDILVDDEALHRATPRHDAQPDPWLGMFDHQRSATAALFG